MADKKEQTLRVRLTNHEAEKLLRFAERKNVTISHIIREYIRRIPNPG